MTVSPSRLSEPTFWHQQLDERMAQFAEIREHGPILPIAVDNPLTETTETIYALTQYDEVVHVSKHPEDFCSGRGATSLFDLPMEMLEFFGGFVRRTPNPHVGFGGPGPHFCLGAHLARRELAVVFRELFRRLPDLEVTGPAVPLQSAGIPLVTGIKRLPVRFTPTAAVGRA